MIKIIPFRPLTLVSPIYKCGLSMCDLFDQTKLLNSIKYLRNKEKYLKAAFNYLQKQKDQIYIPYKVLGELLEEDSEIDLKIRFGYLNGFIGSCIYNQNKESYLILPVGITRSKIGVLKLHDASKIYGIPEYFKELELEIPIVNIVDEFIVLNLRQSIRQILVYSNNFLVFYRCDTDFGVLKIKESSNLHEPSAWKLLHEVSELLKKEIQKNSKRVTLGFTYSSEFSMIAIICSDRKIIITDINGSYILIKAIDDQIILDEITGINFYFFSYWPKIALATSKKIYFINCWEPLDIGILYQLSIVKRDNIFLKNFDFVEKLYVKYFRENKIFAIAIDEERKWLIGVISKSNVFLIDTRSKISEKDPTSCPLIQWSHYNEFEPPNRIKFINGEIFKDHYGILIWNVKNLKAYLGIFKKNTIDLDGNCPTGNFASEFVEEEYLYQINTVNSLKRYQSKGFFRSALNEHNSLPKPYGNLDNMEVIIHNFQSFNAITILQIYSDNSIYVSSISLIEKKSQRIIEPTINYSLKQKLMDPLSFNYFKLEKHLFNPNWFSYNELNTLLKVAFKKSELSSNYVVIKMRRFYFDLISFFSPETISEKLTFDSAIFFRKNLKTYDLEIKNKLKELSGFESWNSISLWEIFSDSSKELIIDLHSKHFKNFRMSKAKVISNYLIMRNIQNLLNYGISRSLKNTFLSKFFLESRNDLLFMDDTDSINSMGHGVQRFFSCDPAEIQKLINIRKELLKLLNLNNLNPKNIYALGYLESSRNLNGIIISLEHVINSLKISSILIEHPKSDFFLPSPFYFRIFKNKAYNKQEITSQLSKFWNDPNFKINYTSVSSIKKEISKASVIKNLNIQSSGNLSFQNLDHEYAQQNISDEKADVDLVFGTLDLGYTGQNNESDKIMENDLIFEALNIKDSEKNENEKI